ncbi:hypothetical protein Gpo141_00004667 [Globisporangium polare]
MRDEEERLTQEFAATREAINDDNHASTQSRTTQRILLRESLQREDERLREMISSQVHQQLLFGRAFKTAHKHNIESLESNLPAHECIPQVSEAASVQLVQATHHEISERKTAIQSSSTAPFSALGWDCKCTLPSSPSDGASSQYPCVLSESSDSGILAVRLLALRTLHLWTPSNASEHAQLFPAHTQSRLRLLQQIDDRSIIVLQTIAVQREPDGGAQQAKQRERDPSALLFSAITSNAGWNGRTILHVSLVETHPSEVLFFVRSVPPEHYELDDVDTESTITSENSKWLDVFNWCKLANRRHGSIEVTWGSRVSPPVHFSASAFEWLIYELTRVVRWEAAVVNTSLVSTQRHRPT